MNKTEAYWAIGCLGPFILLWAFWSPVAGCLHEEEFTWWRCAGNVAFVVGGTIFLGLFGDRIRRRWDDLPAAARFLVVAVAVTALALWLGILKF